MDSRAVAGDRGAVAGGLSDFFFLQSKEKFPRQIAPVFVSGTPKLFVYSIYFTHFQWIKYLSVKFNRE